MLQLSNVRMIKLTLHGWHDIGFAAPRLLLHLSLGLPHVEDVILLDQSADDDYEFLGTPTGVAAAAANFASSLWNGKQGQLSAFQNSLRLMCQWHHAQQQQLVRVHRLQHVTGCWVVPLPMAALLTLVSPKLSCCCSCCDVTQVVGTLSTVRAVGMSMSALISAVC